LEVLGVQLGNTGTDFCLMTEDGSWEIVERGPGVFGRISCAFELERCREALREEIVPRVIEVVEDVNPDLVVLGTIVDELGLITGPMVYGRTGIPTLAAFGDPWGAPDGDAVGAPFCVAEEHPECVHADVGAMTVIVPIEEGEPRFEPAVVVPGTFPLDLAVRVLTGRDYDEGGRLASEGEFLTEVAEELTSIEIDGKPVFGELEGDDLGPVPPKMEEVLGPVYEELGEEYGVENVLRTVTELVARNVVENSRRYGLDTLVLSGGGIKNELLKRIVVDLWDGRAVPFAGEDLEARGLCLLGLRFLRGERVPAVPYPGGDAVGGG